MSVREKMMETMSRHMMKCDEASYLVSLRQDERLPFGRCLSLRFHLMTCHLCRKYARQIEQLNKFLGKYRECEHDEACMHTMNARKKAEIRVSVENELKSG